MRSRVLIAVLLLGVGAVGGACVYSRQSDKSIQDDFVDVSRLPAAEKQFEELNRIIYSIQRASDVRPKINDIIKIAEADKNNDTAQVYAAILKPMLNMEGIVYRMRFLLERIDLAYVQSITALRAFKRNSGRRAAHIDAFFDYFTTPNPDQVIGGQKGPFLSVAQFQDWMAGTVGKEVANSLTQVRAVANKFDRTPQKAVFHYDIGLVVGEADAAKAGQAPSQTRRLRKVVAEDLWVLVADMEERMGIGHYLASYDLEDLPRFMNALTAKTLLPKLKTIGQVVLPGETAFNVRVLSPKEVNEELMRKVRPTDELAAVLKARPGSKLKALAQAHAAKKEEIAAYADFLTLREPGKKWYLDVAVYHIGAAIDARGHAMTLAKKVAVTANRQEYFLDPDLFTSRPGFTVAILAKRKRELAGVDQFSDRVNGETFPLNVRAMLDKDNPGIQDLKKLFPTGFEGGAPKSEGEPARFAWNYDYGKANDWPDPTFAGVLPGGTDANFPDRLASISRDASTRVLQMWLRMFML